MNFFLPIAGVPVNLALLLAVGAGVGFLSGLLGVGGGFLMTPLLIWLGVDPVVAASSGVTAIVGASTTGTISHWRQGNVDFRMGSLLLAGGLTGGLGGTLLLGALRRAGSADLVILILFVVLLTVLGLVMFVEGLSSQVQGTGEAAREPPMRAFLARVPPVVHFPTSGLTTTAMAPLVLGAAGGVLSALTGSNAFFMVPVMTYLLGMPTRVVVGTSLFQLLFTSAGVSIFQAVLNHSVDIFLALGLLLGSTLGARAGAAAGRRLRAEELRLVLALLVLGLALKLFNDLVALPPYLFIPVRS